MKKYEFLAQFEVQRFVEWAAMTLPFLQVDLNITWRGTGITKSGLGPGVQGKFLGIGEVTQAYQWKSSWQDSEGRETQSCDWASTQVSLKKLSQWLRYEVENFSQAGTLAAATAIVIWGGDRSFGRITPTGAIPFLRSRSNLPEYLSQTRELLLLNKADTNQNEKIERMNSMLTKVHSLLSTDGLPIYDSRVAGAISGLIEIFCIKSKISKLPLALQFKSTERAARRRIGCFSKEGHQLRDPGVIDRSNPTSCAADWVSAKLRLGWLLEAILEKAKEKNQPILPSSILSDSALPDQMRALEAGLFMIGFDLGCLKRNLPDF